MPQTPRSRAEAKAARSRSGRSRRRPGGRRRRGGWLRRIGLGVLALAVLGVIGIGIAYAMTDVPKPNERATQQASVLYYSDGKTVLDRVAQVNRESVDIDKIPRHVQEAFLAAEDRSFYENDGISPKGIGRAVWVTLRGGEQQGGSTITQQYVKNYYLTQDRTLSRKARELLISVKIDNELSKDEILRDYLNTIYFGRNADGIQTAARAYFGKDVSKLSISQGALLATVIRGPSLYDPRLGAEQRDLAESRWGYVMDGMLEEGWITQEERDAARFPKTRPIRAEQGASDDLGFITEEVRDELRTRLKLTDAQISQGGFKIVTTIDKSAQDSARRSVEENFPEGERAKDLHIGLVSIAPGDGAVRAMYGGERFGKGSYFNDAIDGKMQAGSTMKPFTMLAALDKGIPLSTVYSGSSPFYSEDFAYDGQDATDIQRAGGVVNYGNASYGPVDMRTATQKSINTYYAQLNIAATPRSSAAAAKAAGVQGFNGGKKIPLSTSPSNVFGTDSVRVFDMANAYATIAAQGNRARPYFIASVTGSGAYKIDYEVKKDVRKAFPQDVSRDAIQAMSQVGAPGGTGYPTVANLGRPVAGKTGTTSNNYAAWFNGFTPGQLATAVGIYKGDGSLVEKNQLVNIGQYSELTGGTLPATIWTDYMIGALKDEPVKQLPPAGNVQYRPQPGVTTSTQPPAPTTTQPPAPTTTQPPRTTSSSTSTSSTTTSSTSTSSSTSTTSSSSTSSSSSSSSTTRTTPPSTSTSSTTSTTPVPSRPSVPVTPPPAEASTPDATQD
ncbi:transglycosylase domain-containing protein [Janibacter melonis]|uniref:transglycosylase domain-containing protein n=1 Tax=Janibacter melonis TaxID=262209 RepID=UPI001782DB76|nr:penicillin-binding protein [Janibacter melonis]